VRRSTATVTPQPSEHTSHALCLSSRDHVRPGYCCVTVPEKPEADIEAFFAYEDDQFDYVLFDHTAERLASDPDRATLFWKHLYRICAHGAVITLRVDPSTAQDKTFPTTLANMQTTVAHMWTLNMDDPAGFASQHNISFGILSHTPVFAYDYHRMIKRRKTTQQKALQKAETDSSVLIEIVFELIANKRFRGFREVSL